MNKIIKLYDFQIPEDRIGAILVALYEEVARRSGIDPGEVADFNCTKIQVSTKLRDNMFEQACKWYQAQFAQSNQEMSRKEILASINRTWLLVGPKASIESAELVAMVDKGFFNYRPSFEHKPDKGGCTCAN